MSHDDYDYHNVRLSLLISWVQVNIYLNRRIKQYIKKVACFPEHIVPSDFHKMGFTFRPDEKVQINLLASEARKCSSLLHALHAVMKYD
jgi:Tfp pilus assembly PilM family ATPase